MAKFGRGRAKRLVLDIGTSAIRLCELTQTKTGFQLTRYRQKDVVIDPALDENAKKLARVDALKALLKEAKVRRRKSVFAMSGRSVFTRTRTLPPVPEYKVSQIVRYEIQQQIPFALDQIALDYHILSRTEASGYDVLMAAIKVDVVQKHLEILQDAKCPVTAVDVCPIAAYNWMKHQGEFGTAGECVALLDMGAATTDIVIERGDQFRFTRPLNLGGNDITIALRDALGKSFEEAEKFKRERGFAPTGDPQRDGKMGEVIGQVLGRLVAEIGRSFAYFRSQPGGGTVGRVVITGGGACLRNIVSYLQRQLNLNVRIAQPLAGLAVAPDAQTANEHPEQATVALGMAWRCCAPDAIEINLIPPYILETARRREQLIYWMLSFLTLAFIGASIIPTRAQKDKIIRDQIHSLEQYVSAYDPALARDPMSPSPLEGQLQAAKAEVQKLAQDLKHLNDAYGSRMFWIPAFQIVNDLRPEGGKVWFSSVTSTVLTPKDPRQGGGMASSGFPGFKAIVQGGGGGGGGGGGRGGGGGGRGTPPPQAAGAIPRPNGLTILGYAKDPDALREFYDQLKQSPNLTPAPLNEALVEMVPITELDDARTAIGPGGAGSGAGRGTPGTMPGGVSTGESVVFFRVDVQFGGRQRQPGGQPAGAGGAPAGPPPAAAAPGAPPPSTPPAAAAPGAPPPSAPPAPG